jgi:hypothetical protein
VEQIDLRKSSFGRHESSVGGGSRAVQSKFLMQEIGNFSESRLPFVALGMGAEGGGF